MRMNKIHYKKLEVLFQFTRQTWSKWKKEERPVVGLFEKYFSDQIIDEYLSTQHIDQFERYRYIEREIISKNRSKYLHSFCNENPYQSLVNSWDEFIDFYFTFLYFLKGLKQPYTYDFHYLLSQFLIQYTTDRVLENVDHDFEEMVSTITEDMKELGVDVSAVEAKNTAYSDLRIIGRLEGISKNIKIFKDWDTSMLLFLATCIEDDFTNLYSSNDEAHFRAEALYHIIGFDIYSSEHTLTIKKKNYLLSKLYRKIIDEQPIKKYDKDSIKSWIRQHKEALLSEKYITENGDNYSFESYLRHMDNKYSVI